MKCIRIFLIGIFCFYFHCLQAKAPLFSANQPGIRPHRVIRVCCAFGSELKVMGVPGYKLTQITGIENIGPHRFLGQKSEGNGIIYTRRGGFIDMAHLRDQIDWTAYLYVQLLNCKTTGVLKTIIGHEGGEKVLTTTMPPSLSENDRINLAAKIAYDLSMWHEISTWFGATSVPFVPERYSSFSPEDAYSNMLGINIGIQALHSMLPYEQAVTELIGKTLKDLDVVQNKQETFLAFEDVRDIWWTRKKRLPSGKITLQRQLHVYPCLNPWLVPGWAKNDEEPVELKVPEISATGESLNNYYKLEFRLNCKFPFRKMFPERKDRSITQTDFDRVIAQIATELTAKKSLFR